MTRRTRALFAVAVLALAAAATTAAPAGAAGSHATPLACQDGTFSSLERLAPAGNTARGYERDKDTRSIVSDSTIPAGEEPQVPQNFSATVPVYFHVITDGRTGWVSKRDVREQITVLNLSFSGFYGGVDTGFRFELAGLDYTDDAEWFAQETFAAEVEMKSALKQGDATALNIYSTSGGGFLGWAYYPSIVVYPQYQVLDGVVIHYGSMPGGPIERFNLGFTATHEAGHWLALAHTFEQGCIGHGDYVDDTPAMSIPTSRCPIGKDTCPAPGFDPIHNYMDYSDDACYNQFTAGQATRAQTQYLHWRVKHGYK